MNRTEVQEALLNIKNDIANTNHIDYYDDHKCIKRLVALIEDIIEVNLY